jgi:hypothetical protein
MSDATFRFYAALMQRDVAIHGSGGGGKSRRKKAKRSGSNREDGEITGIKERHVTTVRVTGLTDGERRFYAAHTCEQKRELARRLLASMKAKEPLPALPAVREKLRNWKSDSMAIYDLTPEEKGKLAICQALTAHLAQVARQEATGDMARILNDELVKSAAPRWGRRAA